MNVAGIADQIFKSIYWVRASVVALIINDSGIYNCRRLEYTVYGIWNAVLYKISLVLSSRFPFPVIVVPQYGIFRNIHEAFAPYLFSGDHDHDADTSSRTQADDTARGVSVDFALAFPCRMDVRAGRSTVGHLFDRISALFWPSRLLQLLYLLLPILVELKRAPTRHPANAKDFVQDLATLLDEAQTQGQYQVHCLFSNVRYGHQNKVIHIAGSGEYWCWREWRRGDFTEKHAVFSFEKYLIWLSTAKAANDEINAASTPDGLDDTIEDELVAPKNAVTTLASRLEEANAARNARALRRAQNNDARQQASQTLPNPNLEEPMFTDDTLNAAAFSVDSEQLPIVHPFMQSLDGPEQRADGYSGVMRLGTPVSDKHITIIIEKVAAEVSVVIQDLAAQPANSG